MLAGIPGFDGSGVTVALLDTGLDITHPYIRDRLLEGADMLDPEARAVARPHPDDSTRLERHGTQMAGLIVGHGGPGGIQGVAPGASILPIRVAGWQPSADGGFAVYGRTDQLLAGLERAVDPDADGDVLDAARIAVVGVTEPFASFADGPVALAVAGAAELDMLVVVPAGNEGPAGPDYGSIGGPGGAPAALTVGAADLRRETATVRVVVRSGLGVLLDRELPLAGAATPRATLTLTVARPRRDAATGPRGALLARYFDNRGYSLVAGPRCAARASDRSHRRRPRMRSLPERPRSSSTGSSRPERSASTTVSTCRSSGCPLRSPHRCARPSPEAWASASRSGRPAGGRTSGSPRVAPFSSHGLSFGGGVKPEVAIAGVELVTADPGRNADRSARYGTISGSSAAAALAGGAAAVLAQIRPGLDAAALKGVLVGTATPTPLSPTAAQGAGVVDAAAASAAEVIADPAAVGFGAADEPGWKAVRRVVVRNVSTRRVTVEVAAAVEGIAGVTVTAKPTRLRLPSRRAEHRDADRARLLHSAQARRDRGTDPARRVRRRPDLRAVGGDPSGPGLGADRPRHAFAKSFRASDRVPAVLTVQAGQVRDRAGRRQLRPLSQLDVELWRGGERLGLLARLRDVLPGRYAFGLTGRGPAGRPARPRAVPPARGRAAPGRSCRSR